ncbi:PAS domain S-box protein [Nitrospira sp. NS4]|uniref:PAS domain S-box protein n=1 Tax=Nitrospira sp. NS4 TaxID=3414498 RepID=UPI003C2B7CBA
MTDPHAHTPDQQTNDLYRLIVDAAPTGLLLTNREGLIILLNQQVEQMFGYRREELVGQSVELLMPPRFSPEHARHRQTLNQAPSARAMGVGRDLYGRRKDGSEFPIEIGLNPVTLPSGTHYLASMIDITARKQGEQDLHQSRADLERRVRERTAELVTINTALREGEERYRLLADATFDGIAIHNQGIIVEANPGLERMFGYAPGELIGTALLNLVADECREKVVAAMQAGEQPPYESVGRRKDGSTFSEEVIVKPYRYKGHDMHLVAIRDITERKRAEKALQSAYQQLSFHIENTPLAVIEWTADMRLQRWSPQAEKIFGWRSEEVEGKYSHEWRFVFTDDTEALHGVIDRLMKGRERQNVYRGRQYTKAGGVVHCVWHNSVLTDERGAVVSIMSLIQDLSGQVRLEQQFHHAQKMDAIGRLAGGIAHDFNNLLTVINGYSDLALANRNIPPRVQNGLQQILNAGHRAASLTHQLLAFSRQQVMQPQVLNINSVVVNMEKLLRRLIGENIKLICRLDEKIGRIKADPGQIEQIVMNLAVNARDAMPNGGQLIIETQHVELDDAFLSTQAPTLSPGPYVLLAIEDTGIGMDDVTLMRIFEPFFTTKGPGKGTGLGLATVHGIVQQSNGLITVSSQLGQGTRFQIYFPRVTAAIQPVAKTGSPQAAVKGTETVLLVEDEPIVRAFARQVLTDHGYAVLEAATAEEGLFLSNGYDNTIHLLLSDVVLPTGGGPLLAKHLRNQRSSIKVLLMSGYIDRGFSIADNLADTTPFIQKPFTQEVLLQKIRTVLDTPETNSDTAQQLSWLT